MEITREELNERLARADRARLALRRTTLELAALGEQLLSDRERSEPPDDARSERSDRPAPGDQ